MESAMNLCKSLPVWVKATELVLCRDSLQRALRYVQGRERDESGDMVIAEGPIHGVDKERLRANQFFIEKIEMYVCGGGGECVRQREKRERKGGGERERETGRERQGEREEDRRLSWPQGKLVPRKLTPTLCQCQQQGSPGARPSSDA